MGYSKESFALFNQVLDLAQDWQDKGRVGYCMPVIRADLLEALEEAVDDRRIERCTWCDGSRKIDAMECSHCKPLQGT